MTFFEFPRLALGKLGWAGLSWARLGWARLYIYIYMMLEFEQFVSDPAHNVLRCVGNNAGPVGDALGT